MVEWLNDATFTGGIHYGVSSAVVMVATNKGESRIIYEREVDGGSLAEIAEFVKDALKITKKHCYFYAQCKDGSISFEVATQYGCPVVDCFPCSTVAGMELMREAIESGSLRAKPDSLFAERAEKVVYSKQEDGKLEVAEVPIIMAVLYAMRPVWMFERRTFNENY